MPNRPNPALLAALFVAALFACTPARAQLQTTSDDPTVDSTYSAEEPPPASGYNAELETRVIRNDNVYYNNAKSTADFVYQEGALLNLWDTGSRWNIGLQYRPTLLHYQEQGALNSFDNDLRFNATYNFGPRLRFQGNEFFDELTGLLEPTSNEYFSPPTSSAPTLNGTLITPAARELSNNSEGHILYDVSPRGSFDLTGSYLIQHFTNVRGASDSLATLFDTNGAVGGLSYQYRLTPRLTLGARYSYQYFHYGLGGSDETQDEYLTANMQITSDMDLDIYGGPSYSTTIGGSSAFATASENFGTLRTLAPVAGGAFHLRSDRTVLQINAQRSVSNGGGLLMTVTSSYEGGELRRQLGHDWDFVITGTNAQSVSLQGQTGKGVVKSQSAGTAFEHPLFGQLSVHFEYDYMRQRVNTFVPLGTNVDINEFSVGVFYRIGAPRL